MAGMHFLQGQVGEVEHEGVLRLMELEAHRGGSVDELEGVPDIHRMNGFRVDVDVHRAVHEIDLLVAFRAPGAAGVPTVTGFVLHLLGLLTIERIGEDEGTEILFSRDRKGEAAGKQREDAHRWG